MTTPAQAEANANRYYEKATANTRKILAAVKTSQWPHPTPCTDWNVKQLVNHMVSGARNVTFIMEGQGPQNIGDALGDDPLASFDEAVKSAVAAANAPNAMSRTVKTRRGELPAGEYLLGQVQEMLVHGWDLAKAIGADTKLDPELMEVCYARALRNREGLRTGSTAWGPAEADVPGTAGAQTKYLAILGRIA